MQTEQKTHTTTFAIFDDLKRNTQQVVFDLKRDHFSWLCIVEHSSLVEELL